MEGVGFVRGTSCGVVFYHEGRYVSVVVHGDDFTACGFGADLKWLQKLMGSWFEIKVRAILGPDEGDDKEVIILGRHVSWTEEGIEWKADPKHRQMILEYFGFDEGTRPLSVNGDKEGKIEEGDEELLGKAEAKVYRGLAARLNYLSQDCPDLQFGSKDPSKEMANPTRGSWKVIKKVASYLSGVEEIVWLFKWQDEPECAIVKTDGDWGGTSKDRKSTSGGVWQMGEH